MVKRRSTAARSRPRSWTSSACSPRGLASDPSASAGAAIGRRGCAPLGRRLEGEARKRLAELTGIGGDHDVNDIRPRREGGAVWREGEVLYFRVINVRAKVYAHIRRSWL